MMGGGRRGSVAAGGGIKKRRRDRLVHRREKRGELAGDDGAEAHRRKRWSRVMGPLSEFGRSKWKG